jgi:hypothetical protein
VTGIEFLPKHALSSAARDLNDDRRSHAQGKPPSTAAHALMAHVLASNPLAVALSPRLRPGENRLRSLLLDPEERAFHQDWEASTAGFVAAFRKSIGDETDDARIVELVGELSLSSERFRRLWGRHDVRELEGGSITVNHPVVGTLRLNRDKLPAGRVILVLYYPDQGTESADKLRMLASLTADATI